jgi:hypothetical protein
MINSRRLKPLSRRGKEKGERRKEKGREQAPLLFFLSPFSFRLIITASP